MYLKGSRGIFSVLKPVINQRHAKVIFNRRTFTVRPSSIHVNNVYSNRMNSSVPSATNPSTSEEAVSETVEELQSQVAALKLKLMLQKREMEKLLKENASHYSDEGDFDLEDEVAAGNHEEMMNFLGEKFREVLIAIDGMPKKTERDSTRTKHSKENTAFISGIPEVAVEDDIRQLFSRYGTIERLTMFRHRKTQTFKGTAFVKFSS